VYLVLTIESTCLGSVGEHKEIEEATRNQKAKAMKKMEAKGQTSTMEAEASIEEAEELVESGNK